MVDDYGLIGGIGQGIQKGLLMYQQQKQLNRENQIQNLTAGIQSDEDGNLQLTPQAQQHKQAQGILDQNTIDANDKTSDLSKSGTAAYKQSLESVKPGSSASVPDMTYNQVKEIGVQLAKPQITGQYGLIKTDKTNDVKQTIADQGNDTKEDIADKANKTRITTANIGATAQQNRQQYQQQRLNFQSDKEARSTANNDPMLKQYMPRLEGAAKIGELIDAAQTGKVVSNQALLGQTNAEIARLETGSQSPGLGASEKTELQDKKAQLQAWVDSFSGDPQAAVDPRVLDTGKKLVTELSGSYQRGIDSRMEYLKGGASDSQKNIYDSKRKALIDTYAPRLGGQWNGQPQSPSMLGGAQPQQAPSMLGGAAQQGAGSDQFAPDVLNYAKTHNITPQEAQNVKNARGGR